jgi:hypothetical protein
VLAIQLQSLNVAAEGIAQLLIVATGRTHDFLTHIGFPVRRLRDLNGNGVEFSFGHPVSPTEEKNVAAAAASIDSQFPISTDTTSSLIHFLY